MKIDASMVKQLREETGLGVMDCKKALEEAGGEPGKAKELLKLRGLEIVSKKNCRTAKDGLIAGYVHTGGKIGVMVEVNCETDFVARNELFQTFAKNICLQIAAANPSYVRTEEVPETVLAGIPAEKQAEFYREKVLLSQVYIREPEKTVQDYLNETLARIGEKILIRRFTRWELGE